MLRALQLLPSSSYLFEGDLERVFLFALCAHHIGVLEASHADLIRGKTASAEVLGT